jgi:putative ABC transport system permease protein
MGRLAWSHLRFRSVRLIALLAGMLLATTAFTVLTAASRTSQLRTVGTVSAHFVPAYEILVRPQGARTKLEEETDTVQPNFLSGIYGGITMAQYHQIAGLPGVQVAAPIAMVGYTLLGAAISFQVPAADYARPGRQLYRYSTTWVSDGGTSRIPQPASYLYVTPNRLSVNQNTLDLSEAVPGHKSVITCPSRAQIQQGDPFGVGLQSSAYCQSKVNGNPIFTELHQPSRLTYDVPWVVPVLIAAVDPKAEAELDGLNHAVISGKYLAEESRDGPAVQGVSTFPVLASSTIGMNEYASTELQALGTPQAPPSMTTGWMTREATAPGTTLAVQTTTASQAYGELLKALSNRSDVSQGGLEAYWSVGPVTYRRSSSGALVPLSARNSWSDWYTAGITAVSMDNADNQYRKISVHTHPSNQYAVSGNGGVASPQLVGVFSPSKIKPFDPLSQVPLGAYQPVAAAPASAASKAALHGADLLPNSNLGGYVSQPVDLITTLSALPVLENSVRYGAGLPSADPISVIRVRVAGITGPNPVSLERIREVAQQIELRTHLDVDIVAGSSPTPTTIDLPAGQFGQPALALSEGWVKKNVATTILTAVDKNSVVLFGLILIVCVLFVANSASAAIRGRRRELGVLACLGWTRSRLFATVLGELAALGLAAGVLGAAVSIPLSSGLGLRAPADRAVLAIPVAVIVAVIAGLVPAWLASRSMPVNSVRPPVLGVRRARQPGGVTSLAVVNVLRTPGRALVGAISLAVGICALTLVTAVTFAFRGVLIGSLLGDAVAVQVRGVDYVAATATVALGVLAVGDVVFLGITERAAELATIRALGWRERALGRLVVTEGVVIGLVGSLAGAALGLYAAARFAGQLPDRLYVVAAAAVAGGVLVTAVAALLPAQALRRIPTAQLLAEE